MYQILKFFLFQLDAEKAHHLTLNLLKTITKIPFVKSILKFLYQKKDKKLERNIFGLQFKNPVGLAAGLDKNASCIDGLAALGFGFVEVGTTTPLAQDGNDKPRLFRLIKDQAIINRMGFNNDGAEKIKSNILASQAYKNKNIIIGGNIGKNKNTPNEKANEDYIKCFNTLYDVVDYFVVNISSPNTPNLRDLQDKEPLKNLLLEVQKINQTKAKPKPLLLKIAPDLTSSQLDDIIEVVTETKLDGIIATNTTISRNNLTTSANVVEQIGNGGLSGKPITQQSTEVIKYIAQKTNQQIPIIAVGGVMTAQDAIDKLNAGAALVQIYTGFVYNGPSLIKEINQKISKQ